MRTPRPSRWRYRETSLPLFAEVRSVTAPSRNALARGRLRHPSLDGYTKVHSHVTRRPWSASPSPATGDHPPGRTPDTCPKVSTRPCPGRNDPVGCLLVGLGICLAIPHDPIECVTLPALSTNNARVVTRTHASGERLPR